MRKWLIKKLIPKNLTLIDKKELQNLINQIHNLKERINQTITKSYF